jgi:predicted acyltransferase
MTDSNRIASIDVMRGLTVTLMLFLNDLSIPAMPPWLGNIKCVSEGLSVAKWVLPGFLFIMGMAIPFSISKRIYNEENKKNIIRHIIIRTISLLILSLLILNSERVNSEFTGIGKYLWAVLMYTGVFLIWNKYQETDRNFFTIAGLKLTGIAILVVLVYKFRSGEFENNGSLIIGSWGLLGIIGWGYLVSALTYLTVRNNILNTTIAFLFFLIMSILSNLNLLSSLNPLKPIFGVLIEGNVPMIVLSGIITALILKKFPKSESQKIIVIIVTIGVVCIIAGFLLSKWITLADHQSSPSQGLIYTGISMIIFSILFWAVDIKRFTRWTLFMRPAGENSLTTYLIAGFLYSAILASGMPILFYKNSSEPLLIIAGSMIWAIVLVRITALLVRYNTRLSL